MFCQTQDEALDFLNSAFPAIDSETLLSIYNANAQSIDRTMEALVSIENPNTQLEASVFTPSSSLTAPVVHGTVINKEPRGHKMSLPDDFLRVPGWKSRHSADISSNDFMSLLADPVFLRELQREFGPDYELILREHLRAEMERIANQLPPAHELDYNASMSHQLEQPVLDPVSLAYDNEEYGAEYYGEPQEEQSGNYKYIISPHPISWR